MGKKNDITLDLSDENIDMRTIWFENGNTKTADLILIPQRLSKIDKYSHYVPILLTFKGKSLKEEIPIDELLAGKLTLSLNTGKNTAVMFESCMKNHVSIKPLPFSDRIKREYDYMFTLMLHVFTTMSNFELAYADIDFQLIYNVRMNNFAIFTPKDHMFQIGSDARLNVSQEKTSSIMGLDGRFLKIANDKKINAIELVARVYAPVIENFEE